MMVQQCTLYGVHEGGHCCFVHHSHGPIVWIMDEVWLHSGCRKEWWVGLFNSVDNAIVVIGIALPDGHGILERLRE